MFAEFLEKLDSTLVMGGGIPCFVRYQNIDPEKKIIQAEIGLTGVSQEIFTVTYDITDKSYESSCTVIPDIKSVSSTDPDVIIRYISEELKEGELKDLYDEVTELIKQNYL